MHLNSFDLYILKDEATSYKTYTYVIVDKQTKKTIIIDPACEQEKLKSLITNLSLKPQSILLTHTHVDHIRQVEWLNKTFCMDVCLSVAESHFYDYYVPNMKLLQDQEQLHIGNTIITCLHTPGHSKGSMCYLIGDKLFTGDTVFIEGCGICNASGGSAVEMYHSIQRLKQLIPMETEIYPGHCYDALPGKQMTYLYEHNIYFIIDDPDDFVNFRMRKNQSKLFDFK